MARGATLATVMVLVCLPALAGCQDGLDGRCVAGLGKRAVFMGGGMQGRGTVTAKRAGGDRVRVHFELTSPSAEAPVQVSGEGRCVDGVVRVRLPPNVADTQDLKIVDGAVVSVLSPAPLEKPFGVWEVEAVSRRDNKPLTLVGYWREAPDAAPQGEGSLPTGLASSAH